MPPPSDACPLSDLAPAARATVRAIGGGGALRQRLLDMGVVPGVEVEVVRVAPLGDPVEYMVRGYRLSLRRTEAACVTVCPLPCEGGPGDGPRASTAAAVPQCPRWRKRLRRRRCRD
jgi:Fe2+ transport system protein FeoA